MSQISYNRGIRDLEIPLDPAKTNICSGQALPLLGGHLPTSSPAGAFAGVDMFAKNTQHFGNIELIPTIYLQPWLMYLLAASDEQGPASIPNKV